MLATALLVTAIVVQGAHTASDLRRSLQASAREHATTFARVLARGVETHLVGNDFSTLEHLLLESAAIPAVKRVQVVDHDRRVVSHVVNDDGRPFVVFSAELATPPAGIDATVREQDDRLDVWQPVMAGTLVGWVHLQYSLENVRIARDQVIAETLASVLFTVALCVGALWWYLRRPLLALRASTAFAERLGEEASATLISRSGVAEFDQLRDALNRAAHELDARRQALSNSREQLQAILRHAADGIITIDARGEVRSFNAAAERLFGYDAAEVVGRNVAMLMPEPHGSEHDAYIGRYLATGQKHILGRRREVTGRRKDGSTFPMELAVSEIALEDERLFTGIVRDVADRKRAEELSSRLGRILEYSSNEIYIFDAHTLRFESISQGALQNLGYSKDEITQLTPVDLKPDIGAAEFEQMIAPLRRGEKDLLVFETTHQRKDGSTYPVEVRLQLSNTGHVPVFMAIIQDITERKNSEAQLRLLANFDTLTGLPNRAQLQRRMQQAIHEADRNRRVLGAMFVDLDRFKLINDTMGHEAGDELLKIVAHRIAESLRPGDTVARYGGDEFVVLMSNVAEIADVDRLADKLLRRLSVPVRIAGREIYVTPSIGVSIYPLDARSSEELLKHADAAMYHAKDQGRNCCRYFTADLNARAARRLSLESSLRRAIERNEFALYYQPQINAVSGAIVGAEALVRWHHPELGLVPPNEFIPLAEDTGMIVPLGRWVLETACADAARWRAAGYSAVGVAVNISGRQMERSTLLNTVSDALKASALDARALELELTESLLMQNLDETAILLQELTDLGASVSMDDFGTGYSSLSYLKRLPIQSIKIDRSFVRDVTADSDTAAIVSAIVAMARGLKLNVVAEGVETREQFDFLRLSLCGVVQGYFFSRPVPLDEFMALLRNSNARFVVPELDNFRMGR
jgi:diguanylate cyclase (GGDEF)-like protein/PAS domain S-box-containing protein